MSNQPHSSPKLSPLKQAYMALEKMQAKLNAVEQAAKEPIAIVGVGCRLPGGVNNPEMLWNLLLNGVDTITEVPPNRWDIEAYYDPDPDTPGKMSTRYGAFLEDVSQFDPQLFGISPREAASMDPQQRLLLEVTWEALENAGQAPDKLSGSRTGVFVGIVNNDYAQLQLDSGSITNIDTYYGSGTAHSIASGRLSYVLGLQGPSVSIDTACSSSLVAIHTACQSLRGGECRMILAGGVNTILIPETTVALSRYKMLAPDGRCKTFDAGADGFVRGEGCVMFVLKRLSDAQADGDNILALIRGSAANQDGPSSGLTAPNGPAQESVILEALANSGLAPHQVTYVEAHGTGTSLGDPIEVQALGAVLGKNRKPDNPILIGSIKTNIGHLESAAGVAGLLKAALILQHKEIPPHLHFKEPNPLVSWDELPIDIPTKRTPWPKNAPLIAGVSSFGFSGTNAHIVLEATPAPRQSVEVETERPLHLLNLSARNEPALQALAQLFQDYLKKHPTASLPDVCFTANTGRAQLPYRLSLLAASTLQAGQKLAAFTAKEDAPGIISGQIQNPDHPKIAFLFTGQGSQYAGMGQQLYNSHPIFRATMDRCDALLRPYLKQPLLSVIYPDKNSPSLINKTAYTQPALFALEYSLAQLWFSWGIKPDVVMGHSVGEYVAACVAGVFSLEDGLKLITKRGQLIQALPSGGRMAAVFADEKIVSKAIKPYEDKVSIAAVNGPLNVVISGVGSTIQAILEQFETDGIKTRGLTVSHAFHSPLLDPVLDDFEKTAATITCSSPQIKLISNVTGKRVTNATITSAAYWRRHLREGVQFLDAMETLRQQNIEAFVEIGPMPTLLGMGKRCLPEDTALWLPSLRKGRDDWQQLLQSLGQLYVYGANVNWAGFDQSYPRHRLSLPTYPFQRKRYWVSEKARPTPVRTVSNPVHPLLGQRLRSAMKEIQFETIIRPESFNFLADHRVHGMTILPMTGYIEIILAAALETFGNGLHSIENLVIYKPLVVPEGEERAVQTIVSPLENSLASFKILSLNVTRNNETWRLHATGEIKASFNSVTKQTVSLDEILSRCPDKVTAKAHYHQLAQHQLHFGPSLHGVVQIWKQDGEAIAQIQLPQTQQKEVGTYQIHPALLDACVQPTGATIPESNETTRTYLPMSLDSFKLYTQSVPTQVWSHISLQTKDALQSNTLVGDIQILDDTGQVLAQIKGLRLRQADGEAVRRPHRERIESRLYQTDWEAKDKTFSPLDYIPLPQQISQQTASQMARLSTQHKLDLHYSLISNLEAVSADYILQAFQKLGWGLTPGQHGTTEMLAAQLGIVDHHRRLFNRFLAILAEDGILNQTNSEWQVQRLPDALNPQKRLREAAADYPVSPAHVKLMERCGSQLAEALTGKADPLQLLFPGGSLETAEQLYQGSSEAHVFNTLAQIAIAKAVAHLPAEKRVRILEVGGGTGGTTSSILPKLPADRTDYLFTDISPLFVSRAEEKFGAYPFVSYQVLDIEKEPQQQGVSSHQFDIVVAVNVLHATADLRQTLHHVQQILSPGGMLLMLEVTMIERWIDISFGMTDGWWRFTDTDVRPDYPLLSREKWIALLKESGFTDVATIPQSSDLSSQALILAKSSTVDTVFDSFEQSGNWMIFADSSGVGTQLAKLLQAQNCQSLLVSPGTDYKQINDNHWQLNPAHPEQFRRLWREAVQTHQKLQGVVHLWNLDVNLPPEASTESLEADQLISSGSVLHLVQAISTTATSTATIPHIWLATLGAQPVTINTSPPEISQAPVWGVGKVISLEHPELQCVRVDLDPSGTVSQQSQTLFAELQQKDTEDQIAYRNGVRHVARLVRSQPAVDAPASEVTDRDSDPVQLVTSGSGMLDDAVLRKITRRPPKAGQVEIRVRATGLNFKDVLNVMGMYPGDPGPLGGECAGEIVALGEGVTELEIGDEVMAVAAGCFSTFVVTSAKFVVRKPTHINFNQAATIPIPYLTAWFALHHLGQISPGDRVLIHAAAGGVGMAAVNLALRAGAEIFGTAGNPEKRAFLKSMGVHHVMDSRSFDFADKIMTLTHGQGVDLILNSLADEFVLKTFSVLAEEGRFLEIGKRGILTEKEAAQLKPNASYFIIDWGETSREAPNLIRSLFLDIVSAIEEKTLSPLPCRSFPLNNVVSAFRYMAQAKHTGKIVVTQQINRIVQNNGTYLITGGLSGLGFLTAQWLVEQGAQNLVLMGRRNASNEINDKIQHMKMQGVNVIIAQGDVSVKDDVAKILAEIETSLPPLKGVIHSAGILDDGVLVQQNWERFTTVMAPKVNGAWLLHSMTKHLPLDFFVLYSSVASLLGSAGQSNHAAANTFMDNLAHYRQTIGLPALSINWGAWSEIGAAVEHNVLNRTTAQGLEAISPEQGLQTLAFLLKQPKPQVGVMPMVWPEFMRQFKQNAVPAFLSNFAEALHSRPNITASKPVPQKQDFLQTLQETPLNKQKGLIQTYVKDNVCKVLDLDTPKDVGDLIPLHEMGLDSLMAVELKNLLAEGLSLQQNLPATLVFDYPTVTDIANYLAQKIALPTVDAPLENSEDTEQELDQLHLEGDGLLESLNAIEDLSDEEVDRLFSQQLQQFTDREDDNE